jgi:crotonobetaine/carnitine-CoA ligase
MLRGVDSAGESVGSLLERTALRDGGRTFLVHADLDTDETVTITYALAHERAGRTAGALYEAGVRPGDRFNVHLTNCPEFYDCWFAAALLGAVIVPTNPLLTADELRFVLEHAGCRVSVSQPDLVEAVEQAGNGSGCS